MQCIYSCPDFFRIDEDTWFFGSLDQQYWLGSYANQTFTPNDFYAAKPGVLLDSTIWKTGAKAGQNSPINWNTFDLIRFN